MTKTIELYNLRINREMIFAEFVKELTYRVFIESSTPYNLVRKGAILRSFLVERHRLIDLVNRNYRFKFKTNVKATRLKSDGLGTANPARDMFWVTSYENHTDGDEISIKKLLALPVLELDNQRLNQFLDVDYIEQKYSYRDIIKLVANAHGGVHFNGWENDKVCSLLQTDEGSPFNINSNSKLHNIINDCSILTLKMVQPLVDAVNENIRSPKPLAVSVSMIVEAKSREEIDSLNNGTDDSISS